MDDVDMVDVSSPSGQPAEVPDDDTSTRAEPAGDASSSPGPADAAAMSVSATPPPAEDPADTADLPAVWRNPQLVCVGSGTYGRVFRAPWQATTVTKVMCMDDDDLLTGHVCELLFQPALNGQPGVVPLQRVHVRGRFMEATMPESGESLDALVRNLTRRADAVSSDHGRLAALEEVWRRLPWWSFQLFQIVADVIRRHGVAHLDVKPANILIQATRHGRAVDVASLIDWGICAVKAPAEPPPQGPTAGPTGTTGGPVSTGPLAWTGWMEGTYSFLPPETLLHHQLADHSSMWSLALVCLFALHGGEYMFCADKQTMRRTYTKLRDGRGAHAAFLQEHLDTVGVADHLRDGPAGRVLQEQGWWDWWRRCLQVQPGQRCTWEDWDAFAARPEMAPYRKRWMELYGGGTQGAATGGNEAWPAVPVPVSVPVPRPRRSSSSSLEVLAVPHDMTWRLWHRVLRALYRHCHHSWRALRAFPLMASMWTALCQVADTWRDGAVPYLPAAVAFVGVEALQAHVDTSMEDWLEWGRALWKDPDVVAGAKDAAHPSLDARAQHLLQRVKTARSLRTNIRYMWTLIKPRWGAFWEYQVARDTSKVHWDAVLQAWLTTPWGAPADAYRRAYDAHVIVTGE